MSAWNELYVPAPVLRSLQELRFTAPTPIQALCLPPAIRDRLDIVGAAETVRCNVVVFTLLEMIRLPAVFPGEPWLAS